MRFKWPLMLVSNHEKVRVENCLLRDALKEANAELRKHRVLLASLKQGNIETTDKVMRAFTK
jgi:hypothetical protein